MTRAVSSLICGGSDRVAPVGDGDLATRIEATFFIDRRRPALDLGTTSLGLPVGILLVRLLLRDRRS